MRYLFQAQNVGEEADIAVLKSGLEAAGIACIVRNEHLSMARGEIPFSECHPELWILDDAHYPEAMELIAGWRNSNPASPAPWVCAGCHEALEGQFTACWNCGTERNRLSPEPTV